MGDSCATVAFSKTMHSHDAPKSHYKTACCARFLVSTRDKVGCINLHVAARSVALEETKATFGRKMRTENAERVWVVCVV